MGIEIHEWPPGAVEQATLIARSLLTASNGNLATAREQMLTIVAALVLVDRPLGEVTSLTDQVLAEPAIAALVASPALVLHAPLPAEDVTKATSPVAPPPTEGPVAQTPSLAAVSSSPNRQRLVCLSSDDNDLWAWDAQTGELVGPALVGHTDAVRSVALANTPEGRLIAASGSNDNTVRIWDVLAGTQIGPALVGHTDAVSSVALRAGADGRLVAISGSHDHTARVWDALAGVQIGARTGMHAGWVRSVALETGVDGRLVALTGSNDRTVRVWDPMDSTVQDRILATYTGQVLAVALGHGAFGQMWAIAGDSKGTVQVRAWDPTRRRGTLHSNRTINFHRHPILTLALGNDRDGRTVGLSGGKDGTLIAWDPAGTRRAMEETGLQSEGSRQSPAPGRARVAARRDRPRRLWIRAVAVGNSSDGSLVAAYSRTGHSVEVKDVLTRETLVPSRESSRSTLAVAIGHYQA